MAILLQAKHLYKKFYHPRQIDIISGINLDVEAKTSLAITGKSGQGKSTLLQILGTLDDPCQGSLEIAGNLITRFNKSRIRNSEIAFVFQSFHLLEDYTAIENVLMPARINRQNTSKGSSVYQRGLELLDQVGLKNRAEFQTKFLSGGEKQRVAIARAFSNNPSIIFADEPSGNLDQETASVIQQLLLDFSEQPGKALIVVTHDESFAKRCKHTRVLENGQLN